MNGDNPESKLLTADVESIEPLNPPKRSSFIVRKKAIDMGKIRTLGKDNIDSAFTGSARSVYA